MDIQKKSIKSKKLKKRFASTTLALILVFGMAMSNVPTMVTDGVSIKVEAASKKKDKKKPVIKMSGKSKLTLTKGVSVKIPKVTAKDNKDGNVTKKIKVTVKKGKKSYSSIAKKIRNNKKVIFTATGKYTITYTVKDKAGNKATKKRTVTVKDKEKVTTEQTTTEETTTETATTETQTTETPVTPEKTTDNTPADYANYDIKTVTYNGNTYKICRDTKFQTKVDAAVTADSWSNTTGITFNIENDYLWFYMDRSSKYFTNSEYIKLLGKITATDANGNDISDSIVVYDVDLNDAKDIVHASGTVRIYAEDTNGNKAEVSLIINYCDFSKYSESDFIDAGCTKLSSDPIVFGELRPKKTTLSQK